MKLNRKFKKSVRRLRKRSKRYASRHKLLVCAALIFVGAVLITGYMQTQRARVNQQSYGSLLETIAKGESQGNYNAYFGNAGNSELRFTDMSIAEVQAWQKSYIEQGNPSNAVGKYQIISTTLAGLIKQLDIAPSAQFDEALQDQMAIALLERRGSIAYVDNQLSQSEFAANIAKEWAALPRITGDNPEQSYYAGDGLNKAQISTEEILKAVGELRKEP